MGLVEESPGSAETKLGFAETIGYGLGDTASNLFWKTFEYFLLFFYTDVFGLSAASVALMFLLTRIWDAVNDPIVGYLADRTRTRWGRFRPYLLFGPVPFALTAMLTFHTPDLSPTGKLIYAYITYTLVMMGYTIVNTPYGALMGVISPSSIERTRVSTYRFVAAFCGGILVQSATIELVEYFGGGADVAAYRVGFFWTITLYAAIATGLFGICFATTRERVFPARVRDVTTAADLRFVLMSTKLHQVAIASVVTMIAIGVTLTPTRLAWLGGGYLIATSISLTLAWWIGRRSAEGPSTFNNESTFANDLRDLIRNGPWLMLFVFGLTRLFSAFIRNGSIIYYFRYYVGDASLAGNFLVIGSVASIIGMMTTSTLVRWIGKRGLMIGISFAGAILIAGFYFLSPDDLAWMYTLHVLASFLGGPSTVLLWSMYADVVDYGEWRTGRRATGFLFSAATFSHKLGGSLGSASAGLLLAAFGYQSPTDGEPVVQSELTLTGLVWMMSLIPAALYAISSIALLLYRIDDRLLRRIETTLDRRRRRAARRPEND